MSLIRQSIKAIVRKSSWSVIRPRFLNSSQQRLCRLYCSSSAIPHPTPDGCEKVYSQKIKNVVEEISKMTLIEVADLNECLKKTLNIKDVPMAMGVMPAAAPAASEADDEGPQVTKSSFTVKLVKFEEGKKVAVIKEIKNLIDGMNLVQAKKFVESCPQVLKVDVGKDEAEKVKQTLEAVGGTCEIS